MLEKFYGDIYNTRANSNSSVSIECFAVVNTVFLVVWGEVGGSLHNLAGESQNEAPLLHHESTGEHRRAQASTRTKQVAQAAAQVQL